MQRPVQLPLGFGAYVANVGIKDDTDDLVVVAASEPASAAGMFTRSRFAGPSVTISREHLAGGRCRGVVIISKNANVATGEAGEQDARTVLEAVAARLDCAPDELLLASTGVIGRRYPMERLLAGIEAVPAQPDGTDAVAVARGMMTTDTVPKVAEAVIGSGPARVVGLAKGVGMIEPDMATMIAVVLTDALLQSPKLDAAFREAVDCTLNCVSIDTDTSTSDTAIVLASGAAGPVYEEDLRAAFEDVGRSLAKQIARDGEGAETLIEVRVRDARDPDQAKRVAKAIVNSPLVKTAIHGRDPNWGRVAMAIGKCQDDEDIDQGLVVIRFGEHEVYPAQISERELRELSDYLARDEVLIDVSLHTGGSEATVWGCDLTAGYVRINADYTT